MMNHIPTNKVLPHKERLKLFDDEVYKLYRNCQKAGYNPDKIRETAMPVIRAAERGKWKTRGKQSLMALVALCLLVSIFTWSPTSYAISIVYRKFMVKILPYYDWTWPYLSDCMLENPYYKEEERDLTEVECEVCRDLKQLILETQVSPEDVSDNIFKMLPTLVGDAMDDWRATKESIKFSDFIKLHLDKPCMRIAENFCHPKVTKGIESNNLAVPALIEQIDKSNKDGTKPNFTSTWMTCNVDTFKEIHKLYHTPYFIPAMCEPIQHKNYVLLGRKSSLKTKALHFVPRELELGEWIAQIDGSFEMMLQPKGTCKDICPSIRFNLTSGQIVNIPTTMYNMAFRPSSSEAVAIGVGYLYN